MVNEAGAIFGLVNLMIRNHFEKQYEIQVPLDGALFIKKSDINFEVQPGYA